MDLNFDGTLLLALEPSEIIYASTSIAPCHAFVGFSKLRFWCSLPRLQIISQDLTGFLERSLLRIPITRRAMYSRMLIMCFAICICYRSPRWPGERTVRRKVARAPQPNVVEEVVPVWLLRNSGSMRYHTLSTSLQNVSISLRVRSGRVGKIGIALYGAMLRYSVGRRYCRQTYG